MKRTTSQIYFGAAFAAATVIVLASSLMTGCKPVATTRQDSSAVAPDRLHALSQEERMAIRARLTRIKADAQRRADEIYDPYASRESKIQNEDYAIALREAGEAELREEYGLSEKDVERLVRDYLLRQGVNISEP